MPNIVLLFGSSPEAHFVAQGLLVQVHEGEPEVHVLRHGEITAGTQQRLGRQLEQVVLLVLDLEVCARDQRALVLDHHLADDIVDRVIEVLHAAARPSRST